MKHLALMVFLTLFVTTTYSQNSNTRKAVFLAHSTGTCIWGPNGSSTSIPQELDKFNQNHGFSPDQDFLITKEDWPLNPWSNEWERWHRIFYNQDTAANIQPFSNNYGIIIIKSCFPSSGIGRWGSASDTLEPTRKTIYNYKWHWRSFIRVMENHPDIFFTVWTNAPLVASATNDTEAYLSNQFCTWAKDTLATSKDSVFGKFPKNVYVFDFYHKLAGPDGKLRIEYAASDSDSHPNSAATELVAPQFVQEILIAAMEYEAYRLTPVNESSSTHKLSYSLSQNYPNPFNPSTIIEYSIPENTYVKISLYNMLGQEIKVLDHGFKGKGNYKLKINLKELPSGIYVYRLFTKKFHDSKKLILMK